MTPDRKETNKTSLITTLSWLCGDDYQAIAQKKKPQKRPVSP